MPIPTLRLDASFEGTILETSDAWFDETDTLVSMDDFVGQTVDIILDAPPSVTLQANQVFNNVVINNITSNGAQYLTGDSRNDLYHVVDGGVVGNGNDDRIFFSYGSFSAQGRSTLTVWCGSHPSNLTTMSSPALKKHRCF